MKFETKISQLDALLKEGGIVVPETQDKKTGISILLKGPAGAGKTTLALLLTAKCAKDGGPVMYCSLEQSKYSLRRLSQSFNVDETGWEWLENDADTWEVGDKGFIFLTNLQTSRKREPEFEDYLEHLTDLTNQYLNRNTEKISMIVIDSLSVFGKDPLSRSQFEALKRGIDNANRILIFIGEEDERLFFDRLVDMVIELGSRIVFGEYFLRTITIKKARFQNHILGSHTIKIKGISPSEDRDEAPLPTNNPEVGFFIYPSLHYHLSVAIERKKRLETGQANLPGRQDAIKLQTGFDALDNALAGGIKRGTMTAISSNISYVARGIGLSFLANGVKNGEKSLYLSLQDDPNTIINLPSNINVDTMLKSGSLVIKSFRPGFISAEEFVDRIINEILDESRQNARFHRVVFDDESQISLRFPLLEKAPVFLPTLMDIFKLYDMTVLFLSTTISSGVSDKPPKDDLYDLVNTAIEVQEIDPTKKSDAHVRIRKIAEQFMVPSQMLLRLDEKGRITIEEEDTAM